VVEELQIVVVKVGEEESSLCFVCAECEKTGCVVLSIPTLSA
jgi:hypothetical protein